MNYSVIDTGMATQDGAIVHGIFEAKTKQVVAMSAEKSVAKAVTHKLNMGAGFDGATPAFFMNGRPQIIPKTDRLRFEGITKT